MKKNHPVLIMLCAATLLFPSFLQAFDNAPEDTIPDMSLAFPFGQQGEQVVNTEDVLINPGCVVPAGSVFLTIFVPPRPEDVDVKKQEKKEKTSTEASYSRTVQLPDKKDRLTPAQKAAFDRATRQPWKSPMIYRAALKQYRFDEARLVFVSRGADQTSLEAFNFPEGMFLGGDANGVKVLAVEKDSNAHRVGLVAGSVLLKLNDQPIQNVAQFQKIYYPMKKASADAGKPVEVTVRLPGSDSAKTLSFSPPPKLGLNDFFSASDVATEPAKKPAAEADPAFNKNVPAPTAPSPP